MSLAIANYAVLGTPTQAPGRRHCRAWDRVLEREVELSWLPVEVDMATSEAIEDRVRRWASVEHIGVAAVLGRGQSPMGASFVISAVVEGSALADAGPRAAARLDRLTHLVAAVQALDTVALVPASLPRTPTLLVPRLDRDPAPGEAHAMVLEVIDGWSLPRRLAQALAAAPDLAGLAAVLADAQARTRRPGQIAAVAAGAALCLALARSWSTQPGTETAAPDCAEVVAERAASIRDELAQADPDPGLGVWLDGWSTAAAATCELGRRATGSEALVSARQACEDELLGAARGVARVLSTAGAATDSGQLDPRVVLGPADACAWTPEDHARRTPWASRPVTQEQIIALAEARTLALLGREVVSAPAPDSLPPRWRGWAEHVQMLTADSAQTWRAASWRRFTAHLEAGDDLGALDALLDRIDGAVAWEVELGPSEALVSAFVTRLEGTHLDDPRLAGWLEPRRARIEVAAARATP